MKDQTARAKLREQDARLTETETLLREIDKRLKQIENRPLYPKGDTNGDN
jgi:hypothetical protein